MKKIIALALALIMVLSMGVVAFAAYEEPEWETLGSEAYPGNSYAIVAVANDVDDDGDEILNSAKRNNKVSIDFTSAYVVEDGVKTKVDYKGIAAIDTVEITKGGNLVITFKENLTSITEKEVKGVVTVTSKVDYEVVDGKKVYDSTPYPVEVTIANDVEYIEGEKKTDEAAPITDAMLKNTVMFAEDGAGYVSFEDVNGSLTGLVKVEKDEKAQVYFTTIGEDDADAIEAYLGEDYEAIVEEYNFGGTGFANEVAFQYDAYSEDPHFFYAWDGEKFVDLEAKFNDDEDVMKYEFTADAQGIIIVTDVEIAAAGAETKNPDTGANDVVGVAAALAVVSLVAAGAVSLKK